ncbi:MAG: transcription elongation factor GreA [Clostridia bacterium]|nr:transcription elongation factor GreA [Clostridia bacterium]
MAKIKQQYNQEGYDKLVSELNSRKNEIREKIVHDIETARGFGDLSENAEYSAAREEQAKNEARIAELEALIENAEVIDEATIDKSMVNIGSVVKVLYVDDKDEVEYHIVSSNEVDPFENKISIESPIGSALSGKKAGDKIEVNVPGGVIVLEVLEVSRKDKK